MAERNRKDYSQRAFDVVAKATNTPNSSELARAKAGAKARATKLTAEQRSAIARKAAAARWAHKLENAAPKIAKPTQKQAREG